MPSHGFSHDAGVEGAPTGPNNEVVHPIQPYQAVKTYICPGCTSTIERGVGHVVVVPEEEPDLRRHWHRGCWYKETRRLGYHRNP